MQKWALSCKRLWHIYIKLTFKIAEFYLIHPLNIYLLVPSVLLNQGHFSWVTLIPSVQKCVVFCLCPLICLSWTILTCTCPKFVTGEVFSLFFTKRWNVCALKTSTVHWASSYISLIVYNLDYKFLFLFFYYSLEVQSGSIFLIRFFPEHSDICGWQLPSWPKVCGLPSGWQCPTPGQKVASSARNQLLQLERACSKVDCIPHTSPLWHPAGTSG